MIARERRGRTRARPGVEGLEARPLLASTFALLPLPGNATPYALVTEPNGRLGFLASRPDLTTPYPYSSILEVGSIDLAGDAVTIFPAPTPAYQTSLTLGPDGNLWYEANLSTGPGLVAINPTTGRAVSFALPDGFSVNGIAFGADGNLYYSPGSSLTSTKSGAYVGEFNLRNLGFTSLPLPRDNEGTYLITEGPDGNIWYVAATGSFDGSTSQILGSLDATTHAIRETPLNAITDADAKQLGSARIRTLFSGPGGDLWLGVSLQYISIGYTSTISYLIAADRIDPTTRALTQVAISSFSFSSRYNVTPAAPVFATGPGGKLSFLSYGLGSVDPTTLAVSPPQSVSAGGGFTGSGPAGPLYLGGVAGGILQATPIPAGQAVLGGAVNNLSNGYYGNYLSAAGQVAYLDLNGDGMLEAGEPTAITDYNGFYSFTGLKPGTYTVRQLLYPGNLPGSVTSATVTLASTDSDTATTLTYSIANPVVPFDHDANPFGSNNPDISTAEVVGLYRIILGRAPDAAGGAAAVAAIKGGLPVASLAANLLHSAESDTRVVVSDYQTYLGRAPGAAEVAAGVNALQGGLKAETLADNLMASAEFSIIHASAASFIQAVVNDTLGRFASAGEVAAISGYLASGLGRASLVSALSLSTEAEDRTVFGLPFDYPSSTDLVARVALLQAGGSVVDLAASLAGSPSFAQAANATVKT